MEFKPLPAVDLFASKADFLSKNFETIEAKLFSYPSYFELIAILKELSPKTLSFCVLLVKCLYYHEQYHVKNKLYQDQFCNYKLYFLFV